MAKKRFEFEGVDNGLSSMMSRLREDSKKLGSELISDARRYSSSLKEQNDFINDQIRALEKRSRLETQQNKYFASKRLESGDINRSEYRSEMSSISESSKESKLSTNLLREVIDTIKKTSKDEIASDRNNVERAVGRDLPRLENQASRGIYRDNERFLKLKEQQNILSDKDERKGNSFFESLLLADMVNRAARVVGGIPTSQTGLDLVSPSVQLGGAAMGAGAGAAVGALIPTESLGIVGAKIGDAAGEFFGKAADRTIRLRESLSVERGRQLGITGTNQPINDISRYGYDAIQANSIANQLALSSGSSYRLDSRTTQFAALQRGFGLDESTIMGQSSLSRIGQDYFPAARIGELFQQAVDNTNIIGSSDSPDNSRFRDLVRNQTQILTQFSQTSENPSAIRANQSMFDLNILGGGFKVGDPRFMQRFSGINQNLSNPESDIAKAQNFAVLRSMNPDAGLFDIMKSQEQGLQTPGFLKAVVDNVVSMGGSEDFQKLSLRSRLPSLSLSAVDRLYGNRDLIGNFEDMERLDGSAGRLKAVKDIEERGVESTQGLQVSSAAVTNAFIAGISPGVKEVSRQYKTFMTKASEEIGKVFKEVMDEALDGMRNSIRDNNDENSKNNQTLQSSIQASGQMGVLARKTLSE